MRLLVTLTVFFTAFCASAQDWETIRRSPNYLTGEGYGVTVEEADRNAIADLISKISVRVSTSSSQVQSETLESGQLSGNSTFSQALNTYSNATLTNTNSIILQNEPDAHVARYILRSEVQKIFEGRKFKVKDLVATGLKAESQGRIDVALKSLYWASQLLKSLQYPSEMKWTGDNGEEMLLSNFILQKLDEIASGVKVQPIRHDGDDLELLFTYNGIPVNSIDYSYFDGMAWSNLYSANDGTGIIELFPGTDPRNLRVKIEYEYRGQAHIDSDIQSVIETFPPVPVRKAYMTINADKIDTSLSSRPDYSSSQPVQTTTVSPEESATSSQRIPTENVSVSSFTESFARAAIGQQKQTPQQPKKGFSSVPQEMFQLPHAADRSNTFIEYMKQVAAAIQSKNYDAADDLFTPEGLEVYRNLIKYGRAKLVGTPQWNVYMDGDRAIGRGLKMAFSFRNGTRRQFVEEVVFTFTEDDKISNLAFGLGPTTKNDILGKGIWSEQARTAILDFMENYQTAYALKRLDYIRSIFDDDAIIIVGSKVRRAGKRVRNGEVSGISFGGDVIRYNRYTKDTYLKHLARSFASKEYINIRFNDCEVRKLGKGGEMYAVQLNQEYYSNNYGDKGYLFLLLDMNDPANPVIKVRTWQPEKDPDFGLYGPDDFH